MSIIQNLQNKNRAQKMRIIWTIAIIAAVLLILIWIISYKYRKNVEMDTSLFQTIDQGIKDVKDNYKK